MTFIPTKEIFSTLVPVALILGVGIGFLGSRFTNSETFKSIIIIMTAWLRRGQAVLSSYHNIERTGLKWIIQTTTA